MATNTYKIKSGDTLGKIAKQYGTTVDVLASTNNIKDKNRISAGASLNIPSSKPSSEMAIDERRNVNTGVTTTTTRPKTNPYDFGMSYVPQQGPAKPTTPTPLQVPVTPKTPEEVKREQASTYANEVNSISEQVANTTQDIPKSRSSEVIEKLYNSISQGEGDVPEAPSLMELYNQTRSQLGIDQDEQDLADIDSELERIQVNELVSSDEEGDRPVGMQQIERRRGTVSKEAQRQMAFLNVERSAVARTVQGKTDALKMVMDFTQQDYANASAEYQNKFNKNIQMIQLLQGQEDRETSAVTRLQDTAKANISTVMSMMSESGKTFDELPANQKAQLQQWELQAGFPAGLLQSLPPEQGELMTLGGNLVRVYPDDTIKVVYSKPASSSEETSSSSTIKLTPTNKASLLGAGFNSEQISGIEKMVSEYGIEAIDGLTDISDKQKQTIKEVYGQSEDSNISGTPSYKVKGFKKLDNNPIFGTSRRSKLNSAGITDDMLSQAEIHFENGYASSQVAKALGLSTTQKNLLDEYIELND